MGQHGRCTRTEHQKGLEGQDARGKGQKEAHEKVWEEGDPETNRFTQRVSLGKGGEERKKAQVSQRVLNAVSEKCPLAKSPEALLCFPRQVGPVRVAGAPRTPSLNGSGRSAEGVVPGEDGLQRLGEAGPSLGAPLPPVTRSRTPQSRRPPIRATEGRSAPVGHAFEPHSALRGLRAPRIFGGRSALVGLAENCSCPPLHQGHPARPHGTDAWTRPRRARRTRGANGCAPNTWLSAWVGPRPGAAPAPAAAAPCAASSPAGRPRSPTRCSSARASTPRAPSAGARPSCPPAPSRGPARHRPPASHP